MPITNLLYLLFVQTLQLVVTAIYLILWSIFYVIYTILEVIYLDIAWFCKRFWWYITWLGYFIHLHLLNLWTIFKTTILWTLNDIYWFGSVIISPFMWTYQTGQYLWDQITTFIIVNIQMAAAYLWSDIVWLLATMWLITKLAVLAVFLGLVVYLGMIFYRFFSRRDFALQCKYYFGPTPPPQHNQGQEVLTITPVMLDPQSQGSSQV